MSPRFRSLCERGRRGWFLRESIQTLVGLRKGFDSSDLASGPLPANSEESRFAEVMTGNNAEVQRPGRSDYFRSGAGEVLPGGVFIHSCGAQFWTGTATPAVSLPRILRPHGRRFCVHFRTS